MDLKKIQKIQEEFIRSLKWERFNASQVFVHLVEEIGEIGKYILYEERYKVKGAGHEGTEENVGQEFAQAFNLFLQLAIHFKIDLDSVWQMEYEINQTRFDKEKWLALAEEDHPSKDDD